MIIKIRNWIGSFLWPVMLPNIELVAKNASYKYFQAYEEDKKLWRVQQGAAIDFMRDHAKQRADFVSQHQDLMEHLKMIADAIKEVRSDAKA